MDKNIVVLYHGPTCPDGFASALACWEYFGDTAEYVPVQYGKPVPQFTPDKHVYIVDFSYDAQTLEDLRHAAVIHGGLVTVLDHHASAQRDLQQYIDNPRPGLEVKFDMEESGRLTDVEMVVFGEQQYTQRPVLLGRCRKAHANLLRLYPRQGPMEMVLGK